MLFGDLWRSYHISEREFYPIVINLYIFGHKMSNNIILFHTDNLAVVAVNNRQTTKNKYLLILLRQFVLNCLHHNVVVKAVHIRGRFNVLSDDMWCLQVTPENAHL